MFYQEIRIIDISKGWASSSINTVIFRKNSITTDNNYQYVAFYNEKADVVLAKRNIESDKWDIQKTQYKGNVKDAHNSISIIVDGEGYLHISWDHHDSILRYCRSKFPGGLELTDEMLMTGFKENNVTYPQFYKLNDGNLLFLYRNGSSGNGNLIINHYDANMKSWSTLQQNLIDGEGQRNAYWQMMIDINNTIHLSWVWRESWDVATNHDICYAKSNDQGKTWVRSNGSKYDLPITAASAEYAARIPQNSELINQTSMYADSKGHPYISNYWVPKNSIIPQYHLVYNNGEKWQSVQVSERKTAFSLSGGGTKRIPISRPQIILDKKDNVYMIYRDIERDDKVSVALCDDVKNNMWFTKNLTDFQVGLWEPTYDNELWKSTNKLHLFIQNVGQGDSETLDSLQSQMVSVLEWRPKI